MAYVEIEKVLKTARDGYHSDFGMSMADLTSLQEVLEDTPSADVVEVKHGKWDYIATHDCFSCNICKFDSDVVMKYCGGCGAKMDLSEKPTGCERRDT